MTTVPKQSLTRTALMGDSISAANMRTNRFYFALIALLGATALIASAVFGGKSYAQQSPQAIATPRPPALWVLNQTFGPNISIFPAPRLKRPTRTVASYGISANV